MKLAVVILNWNGKHLLENYLPSVISYSKEAKIYIIDNASTDDSINFLKNNFPEVTIIQNSKNYGYAKGYNEGLKKIDADIYCLLNSDVEVTPDWITPIISIFEENKEIAIIQPKIKSYNNRNLFEYAGGAGGYIDKYGFPFCRGRIFDTLEEDNGQYNDDREIFWASGACFFIRKSVFLELNGFDEDFFAHQEEIDLCWRALHRGDKVYYTGKSEVFHLGAATLSYENPKKVYLNFRNSLFMLLKNLPKERLISIIFFRMVLDGIAGIYFVFQGKLINTIAIIKAHFSFYRYIVHFYRKREKSVQKNYFRVQSIIYLYYIRKIKFFKNIKN